MSQQEKELQLLMNSFLTSPSPTTLPAGWHLLREDMEVLVPRKSIHREVATVESKHGIEPFSFGQMH